MENRYSSQGNRQFHSHRIVWAWRWLHRYMILKIKFHVVPEWMEQDFALSFTSPWFITLLQGAVHVQRSKCVLNAYHCSALFWMSWIKVMHDVFSCSHIREHTERLGTRHSMEITTKSWTKFVFWFIIHLEISCLVANCVWKWRKIGIKLVQSLIELIILFRKKNDNFLRIIEHGNTNKTIYSTTY